MIIAMFAPLNSYLRGPNNISFCVSTWNERARIPKADDIQLKCYYRRARIFTEYYNYHPELA